MSSFQLHHSTLIRAARLGLLATVVVGLSACVVAPGRHGRIGGHVRVAIPAPIIPIPIPIPVPRHESQPAPYPAPSHPSGHGYPSSGYPSSGYPSSDYPRAGGNHALHGVVRNIESAPGRHGGARVTVQLDDRSWRHFEAPWGVWRVGDRVRLEGDRIHRG